MNFLDLVEQIQSELSSNLVTSTSSISGHTLASSHSKLRKVTALSGGSAKAVSFDGTNNDILENSYDKSIF